MCVITKDRVERHFIPGNELPRFWEGKEVVGKGTTAPVAPTAPTAPTAVAA